MKTKIARITLRPILFAAGGMMLLLASLTPRAYATPLATITVTNNLDETTGGNGCSLREAITNSNNNAATHSDCAAGSSADMIHFSIGGGGTQTIMPSSALPTITDPVTIDGTTQPSCSVPCIVLNGSSAGGSADGLYITAGSSTVKGLVINSFGERGITIETGGSNIIIGNYIGTDATGTVAMGNGNDGVGILYSSNNRIGGTTASERNIISNCGGCYGGVNILFSASTGNLVQGNYIGTDVTGKVAMGNNAGVIIADDAVNNTVGGTAPGAGNLIRFNATGVVIGYGTSAISDLEAGNRIQRNRIFSNTDQGIGLGWDELVTPNDALDADTGPNKLQNFPVITKADSVTKKLKGTLHSTPNTMFTLEFFKNGSCDTSGNGQGKKYIGTKTVTTDANGDATFKVTTKKFKAGKPVTATAIDPDGNTSEFSLCKTAS